MTSGGTNIQKNTMYGGAEALGRRRLPDARADRAKPEERRAEKKKPIKIKTGEKLQKFDFSFFLIVVIMLAFGLVMLFSATYASAKFKWGDSYHYIKNQLVFAGVGLAAMIGISFIDYHVFINKIILKVAIFVSVTLMVMVRAMGHTAGGAERWLAIGGITFQPSEILKLVTIMVIAEYVQRNYDKMQEKKCLFMILLRVGIACGLVVIQPHLSATIIILCISFAMLFVGGAKTWHLLLVLALIVAAGYYLAFEIFPKHGLDYVSARMLSFKDPEADIREVTYQTYQSLVTIGSGGLFGSGLGNSRQKYSYLPVTENDFIFSVIVEELGFVGAMVVILLFIILVVRGYYIASSAPDKAGMLLCVGIVTQIGLQALLNIAVASNCPF